MLKKSLVEAIDPDVNVSLERQLFPEWLAGGKHIQAFVSPAKCVDIGTPERYLQAQTLLAGVELNETCFEARNSYEGIRHRAPQVLSHHSWPNNASRLAAPCSALITGRRRMIGLTLVFKCCDVRDAARLSHLIAEYKPERIFHLAAQSYPDGFHGSPPRDL